MLDVIETVKRVSGVDFKVEIAPRREGDPAQIVADSQRARAALRWQPRFDDLSTIVAHALAWEQALIKRRASAPQGADRRAAASSSRRSLACMKQLENSASAGHGTHMRLGTWRLGTWRLGTWRLTTWRLGT